MFKKIIQKILYIKKLTKNKDIYDSSRLDLMNDTLIYRGFRNHNFSKLKVFFFFFILSSVGKGIVSIIQGTAFSPDNLNSLSDLLNNSGQIVKESLSWIVSLGWYILKIFPAKENVNITFFSDYPDHLLSFFYLSLHSTLIYVHWSYIPFTLENLYKKGHLLVNEDKFISLKYEFNKKYNRFYYKIISFILTGIFICYAYYVRSVELSWWADIDYPICAVYFIIISFILIYYMNIHVIKGFISVKLVKYVTSDNNILYVELLNADKCGGLKKIGDVIIQTFLSNIMTLFTILIIYLTEYLPIKHPLYIFYFAIMASFLPLFAIIPIYKIHKIMRKCKQDKLNHISSLSDHIINEISKFNKNSISKKKFNDLCESSEKLQNIYNSINKSPTYPFNYRTGILNAFIYLLQIAVILFQIIKEMN